MRHGLVALALGPLLAGAAHAGPQAGLSLSTTEPEPDSRRTLNFRLVRDDIEDPGPIHNSGMVADTEVAPNTSLGFGLLKTSPRKLGSGDWRTENGGSRSRKAAVRLQFKF